MNERGPRVPLMYVCRCVLGGAVLGVTIFGAASYALLIYGGDHTHLLETTCR